MLQTKVLLADDRPIRRSRLSRKLSDESSISFVDTAVDLTSAFSLAEELCPDVVLISASLRSADEFSMLRALFDALSIREIVLDKDVNFDSSGETSCDLDRSFDALMDRLSNATVKRQKWVSRSPVPVSNGTHHGNSLILIGASTGGVEALLEVIPSFPIDCPPTLIVQHTGGRFTESLARLLDRHCIAEVREGRDGETLKRGQIRIAPGQDGHMVLKSLREPTLAVEKGPPVSGHRPSVDRLFHSGVGHSHSVVAALLTGMGRDGAEGLAALRKSGAQTIAQNEDSSVVFGMPRSAIALGAAEQVLDINRIGPAIMDACSKPVSASALGTS